MAYLNLSKPLKAKTVKVDVPELDGYVNMRSLTAGELVELQKKFGDKAETESNMGFIIDVLGHSLVDDEGKQMFANGDDAQSILSLPMKTLIRLGNAAVEVSGLLVEKKV